MSTPNPTHIDVIAKHSLEFSEFYDEWRCRCEHPEARWRGAGISVRPLHAAHVVSKLTDAGYSIMPAESAWTLSRAQSLAFGTERMDSGDVEYSRGYNTAVDCFRDVLRVADVEGEKP